MELIFATNNQNKIKEIQNLISATIKIVCLKELGFTEEIPETGSTLESNASQKAYYIYNKYLHNCFADDTGLEIEYLNKRPGVHSARYAGEGCFFEDNMNKVLREMKNVLNRAACFRTVISLIIDGKEKQFEGRVDGEILTGKCGNEGFGYDPIFRPTGFKQTFAEMSLELKNSISHRGRAIRKLAEYLEKIKQGNQM